MDFIKLLNNNTDLISQHDTPEILNKPIYFNEN